MGSVEWQWNCDILIATRTREVVVSRGCGDSVVYR
jgi:hypothetical protein